MDSPSANLLKGIVKQVLSGDTIIIRGRPINGPPKERQLSLSYIQAPRLGKKDIPDEAFAWDSREFLRKLLIAKEVSFHVDYTTPSGKEFGTVFFNSEDVATKILAAGWAKLREGGKSEYERNELAPIEAAAQSKEIGIWTKNEELRTKSIRNVSYTFEGDMREFVDKNKKKPIPAIIERVRDGSTLQVLLLPSFQLVNIVISGIKSPIHRKDVPDQPDLIEPYAAEAKFFTEARLLQQEVKVVFEGVNNKNFIASVVFHAGNIAEALLKEGLAKVMDWSITMVSTGPKSLRDAEKIAKQNRVRIWKDYNPKTVLSEESEYTARVNKIINGESLTVVLSNDEERKLSLSSIRQPRTNDPKEASYQNEAKEFLRSRLIGQKVNVKLDYIKPAEQGFEERICVTITLDKINIAEALVSKGFATVIRHRQDDENRSSQYDQLLIAEENAIKNKKGIHSSKEFVPPRIVDASENVTRAKQFLPGFQRQSRVSAVVEYVHNGSRFKLLLPKEGCRINFVLSGVSCGRVARTPQEKSEPFANEARIFASDKCFQHDVDIQVEGVDKGGNFIGQILVKGQCLAVLLLEQGLGTLHEASANQTNFSAQLFSAQTRAKQAKKGVWLNYEETKEEESKPEEAESSKSAPTREFIKVVVSEILDGGHFFVQIVGENVKAFERLMDSFRQLHLNYSGSSELELKKGALVSAKFSEDKQWYRGRIQKVLPDDQYDIFFIDFGNGEVVSKNDIRPLQGEYATFAAQAHECVLAGVRIPGLNEDFGNEAGAFFSDLVLDVNMVAEIVTRVDKVSHVVLYEQQLLANKPLDNSIYNLSVNARMLEEGLGYVVNRRERNLQDLIAALTPIQEEAKNQRLHIWRYGDCTPDDDRTSPVKRF